MTRARTGGQTNDPRVARPSSAGFSVADVIGYLSSVRLPPLAASPRAKRIFSSSAFALVALITAGRASAGEPRAKAPAGGGLDALEVEIDETAGALVVHRCKGATCGEASKRRAIPIPLDRARLDLANASVTAVPIGAGKHVVHARVPDLERKELAFEAIVAGDRDEPIFAGLTGYARGEHGDRSGVVVLVHDRDERSKFVLFGEVREDTRICGQATTPLRTRGIDARTMQLRGATLHRIDKRTREGAAPLVATARDEGAKPPLARVLLATGGSAPGAQALTDGDPGTAWSEARPGDGHGEFVTMRAPVEVPIHALAVTVAPSAPKPDGAAPRSFFVATDERVFHVTLPEDGWRTPGASFEVALPEPVRTSCVAVVLDEAYARGLAAPDVSIAEVSAITQFDRDGATMDDVAAELSGARAEEATAMLLRADGAGLEAVAKRWEDLDPRARTVAVDVAASTGQCDGGAMSLLTRALADADREVTRRALGRVERCGKDATEALALAVRSEDEAQRAAAAPLLATISPSAALAPIRAVLGAGRPETRRALRGALARASTSSPPGALLALFDGELGPEARLDLLRALGPRLAELRPASSAALAHVLGSSPDMATRWLAVQPLAHLARASGSAAGELTLLGEMMRRDPDWPVRARAVELGAGIAPLAQAIVAALDDPAPRVREAALHAIASAKLEAGSRAAGAALADDPWTFVRVAAAEALGAAPPGAEPLGALAGALHDASPQVRGAAIVALGRQRADALAPKIRARLDDTKEDTEVRAIAARTLGAMCVRDATDRLEKLALLSRSPVDEADERLGMAAIDALSALHPADLEARLAPLRAKEVRLPVRRAVERALAEPGVCR